MTLTGHAKGAVLVRNPDFALTMSHPATVRSGEAYDLFLTVTNTGKAIANLVSVHLDPRALSGAAFADGEQADKEIETILPGSSATVDYHLISQRTGAVTATVFRVGGRQGALQPAHRRRREGHPPLPRQPDPSLHRRSLPPIWSMPPSACSGRPGASPPRRPGALPAEVLPIAKSTVTDRAYDLSEAGLRLLIGDTPAKALEDFTFDFFGSDRADAGFDDLRRALHPGLEAQPGPGRPLRAGDRGRRALRLPGRFRREGLLSPRPSVGHHRRGAGARAPQRRLRAARSAG